MVSCNLNAMSRKRIVHRNQSQFSLPCFVCFKLEMGELHKKKSRQPPCGGHPVLVLNS